MAVLDPAYWLRENQEGITRVKRINNKQTMGIFDFLFRRKPKPKQPVPTSPAPTSKAFFGWNTKGLQDVDKQCDLVDQYLAMVVPQKLTESLVIRVTGGTVSQTTPGTSWTDYSIGKWCQLQRKYGVRFVYVVNGNEIPVLQGQCIRRWLNAGAKFDFIEMMNEYYLPKYERGELQYDEVSRKVSASTYVNDILPMYWQELDALNLPYYVILSPQREGRGGQARTDEWNDVLVAAINGQYKHRKLGVTLHLYAFRADDMQRFAYDQIDTLRARLPEGTRIAITEAGMLDTGIAPSALGAACCEHYNNIMEHLRTGDYLLDQVLYNHSNGANPGNLSPHVSGGITSKGKAVMDWVNTKYAI